MRVFMWLLVFVIMLGSFGFSGTSTKASGAITEKEFLKLVEKTDSYKAHRKELTNEPLLHETVVDGVGLGRVARYAFEYNHTEKDIVKLDSYLTYAYDYKTGELEELIVDYSLVYKEQRVLLHNLSNGQVDSYDVSQEEMFQEYINEINKSVEEESIKAESENGEVTAQGTVCWQCSKYESSPHDRATWCDYFFGVGCGYIGTKTTIAGWLLCSGIQGIACWIPAYKICIAGKWMTTCPV